ncbi:PD-(D/E)XK nuclease family protein [Christiangramia fulva]|nr:PD-(D/E)XK nuclease family protein [Christiangramia fulva]
MPLSEMVFVLPSKRAGAFLLNELAKISETSLFAPEVLSIEEFTEQISELQLIDNTISLFEFYEAYTKITPEGEREDFETFSGWAQNLLHDFNEIDRYLIDYRPFFDYLSGIQDIKHWYLRPERTELIEKYLHFWKKLPEYYETLRENLLENGLAYQGLIYRIAAEKIQQYAKKNNRHFVFIGFNALNSSEQEIIHFLLKKEQAEVFWDLDEIFYNDQSHAASIFIRKYLKDWEYYQNKPFKNFGNQYAKAKNIQITGVPKNIGQAKYIGELLGGFDQTTLENTAVVLGEEELLLPVLNSLPPQLQELNITMGFPVKNSPVNSLFESLFLLHTSGTGNYYYKDVLAITDNPCIQPLLKEYGTQLTREIHSGNLVYLSFDKICGIFSEDLQILINACFKPKKENVPEFLESLQKIIYEIKEDLKSKNDKLGLEFLYHFHRLFNKLQNLTSQYPHIKNLRTLFGFYKELVSTETLDFQGRPFKGLQLMGMLESRALDFETVIISSLNEGVLPAGKSESSFIPYDLKKQEGLPTYLEKDAVYTYHFYRLLQRAKNVYLLYNTEVEGLNSGEKSRFITQLLVEKQEKHHLESQFVSPQVPKFEKQLKEIHKTPEILEKIKSLASSGFSPSALTSYIRNPLDFYVQYILGIRDQEEVEETVAYNTLGTVVHNTLEAFYLPLEGRNLRSEDINSFRRELDKKVSEEFAKTYSPSGLNKGKNLLIYEVARRYIQNFLKFEQQRLLQGDEIQIIQIEKDLRIPLPVEKLDFPVYLRGKVDRYELLNGIPTVIDYKTGKVIEYELAIDEWAEITKDYDKYSKCFQVLTYVNLLAESKDLKFPAEAGIISFKNLKNGFLKFAEKEKGSRKKDSLITQETLAVFREEVKKLICEICDPEIPFIEKEIKKSYGNF